MAKMRRMSGFIAAVLVLLMAGGFLFISPSPILSACFIVAGIAGMVWQAKKLTASREDPYDLSRLWDRGDEPEDDGNDAEDGTLFCHNCGHAVPRAFARCPDCGNQLR